MIQIREPQQIVLNKITDSFKAGKKKVLVFAPTGFGKTILSYFMISGALIKNNRVLFTSHRITLAEQSAKTFAEFNPEFIQGENKLKNYDSNLIVGTLQSLINSDIPEPKIIILDEVHYSYKSELIQSLFNKFPNAYFIGLSATPVDDRDCLLEGFDVILDDYQTADLINLGWLVPFKSFAPINLDLSKVSIKNDYDSEQLSEVVNTPDINKSIVENYIKLGEDKKFICFATDKAHCKELKNEFLKQNITVEIIDADTHKKQRTIILDGFKNDKIKGLISIEILTAGFDEPSVGCVILASPTKSWKKFIQMCGRGIRLFGLNYEQSKSNGKEYCILLDCGNNILEHGLPDERKKLFFGKKISRVIDRELNINENTNERSENVKSISEEKKVFLKKIGSLLDLYEGKEYSQESDLQEDVNGFLKKTGYFFWRQNSGKMLKDGRWVHFTSVHGLPDNSVFYKDSTIFFGIELKTKRGVLTKHQKETLPILKQRGVVFFICESVFDVYRAITHLEENTEIDEERTVIYKSVYVLPQWQLDLQKKLKLL